MVKPAVDKLPLTARKALKDTWDAKKSTYDEKLSSILGDKWEYTFDPPLVYANCQREDLLNRLGEAIGWYVDAFAHNIDYWLKNKAGSGGKADVARLAPKKTVVIEPQTDTKFNYGGVVFKDGVIKLVFADQKFGSNVQQISGPDEINAAVNEAAMAADGGSTSLTPDAKKDIEKYYDAKIETIRADTAKLLNLPALTFEPNFEANAAALVKGGKAPRLQAIGQATLAYFNAVQRSLDSQKFGGDDMLQEGFADAVSTSKIGLRVVDALKKKKYNEVTIEDGTLWIDVTAATWWGNVDEAGRGVIDLL